MSEEKVKTIIKLVNDGLEQDVKYFDIEKSEILVEEEDCFSMTVCVKPKKEYFADSGVKAVDGENYLQIDFIDNEYYLMVGEDAETGLSISRGNMYSQFYWGEVLHEI